MGLQIAGLTHYPWWGDDLEVDGIWGVKTEAALGAHIIRAAAGELATWFTISTSTS